LYNHIFSSLNAETNFTRIIEEHTNEEDTLPCQSFYWLYFYPDS